MLLVVAVLASCERIETQERQFLSLAQAQSAGAVGPDALLPAFLPVSARNIRFSSNLDTNERWITFEFSAGDAKSLFGACGRPIESSALHVRAPPRGKWPAWLTSTTTPAAIPVNWYIGECDDGGAAAIDTAAGVAAYWRPY